MVWVLEEGMDSIELKKTFLITLIVSLSVSALVGIVLFLIGSFGDLEVKILFTTLVIGLFSLTGLCGSILYSRDRFANYSLITMVVSISGLFLSILSIWEIVYVEDIWKALVISIILSIAFAHSCLMLLIDSEKRIVNILLGVTHLFIFIVSLMLILLVVSGFDIDYEFYYRLIGVFAILDVLGTIVTPIVNKIYSE